MKVFLNKSTNHGKSDHKGFRLKWPALFFLAIFLVAPSPSFAKMSEGIRILKEMEGVFIAIADKVKPAVVNISPASKVVTHPGSKPRGRGERPPRESGSGTGVIIDKTGYIVTNNHVVGDAKEVEVRLSTNKKYIGKVIGTDPDTDLAVIKIESGYNLPVVPMGDSSTVKVGQWVIAVGNPFGLDRTVTIGVVSAIGRENVNLSRYEDFIQTDASINPGNSGGPLFNIDGEAIGINTAIINYAQGIGFAIPSNMVQNVVEQLIANGRVVRGWLGVGIQSLTPELALTFDVNEGQGVLINEVFEGDPAEKAGIKAGDIIVKLNGRVVDTPQTLSRLIAALAPGKDARLEVVRGGDVKKVTVKLGERTDTAITASIPPRDESFMGFNVQDLTPELAERFKLKEEKGVLITQIKPGSIAETEGIKEGDLIREINRNPIDNSEDFKKAVEEIKEGDSVLIRVIRENRAFYVVLKTKSD